MYCQRFIDDEIKEEEGADDIEEAVVIVANKMALEGWELVSVCPTAGLPETLTAFFKRS